MTAANGGSFKDGFIGGAIGFGVGLPFGAAGVAIKGSGVEAIAARTAIAAVGGGVGSKLAGGSFEEGAYSAAFFHLFNNESQGWATQLAGEEAMIAARDHLNSEVAEIGEGAATAVVTTGMMAVPSSWWSRALGTVAKPFVSAWRWMRPAAKSVELGRFSHAAANGVGQVFSPKVVQSGESIVFHEFALGTQHGLTGLGAKGAAELIGPMRQLVSYSQQQGAKTITINGKYVTSEGAALGGGKIGDAFSFTFDATDDGLKSLLSQLRP
jgi:hypothetical protein